MPTVTSPSSATASGSVTSTAYWLKDPTDSSRNRSVWVSAFDALDVPRDVAVFEPLQDPTALGPQLPVVAFGAVRGVRSRVTLHVSTGAERTAVQAMLDSKRALLLQAPLDQGETEGEQWYLAVTAATQGRVVQGRHNHRELLVDWVQVPTP